MLRLALVTSIKEVACDDATDMVKKTMSSEYSRNSIMHYDVCFFILTLSMILKVPHLEKKSLCVGTIFQRLSARLGSRH